MTDWTDNAACNDRPDVDFFPSNSEGLAYHNVGYQVAVARAKALCAACPVKDDCLTEGLRPANMRFGIWGGATPKERAQIRRARRAA